MWCLVTVGRDPVQYYSSGLQHRQWRPDILWWWRWWWCWWWSCFRIYIVNRNRSIEHGSMRGQGVENSITVDDVSPLDPVVVPWDVLLQSRRRVGRLVLGCRLLSHKLWYYCSSSSNQHIALNWCPSWKQKIRISVLSTGVQQINVVIIEIILSRYDINDRPLDSIYTISTHVLWRNIKILSLAFSGFINIFKN